MQCKCVARFQREDVIQGEERWPDPVIDRCKDEAGEDGFCDHCHPHKAGEFVFGNGMVCREDCCQSERYFRVPLSYWENNDD